MAPGSAASSAVSAAPAALLAAESTFPSSGVTISTRLGSEPNWSATICGGPVRVGRGILEPAGLQLAERAGAHRRRRDQAEEGEDEDQLGPAGQQVTEPVQHGLLHCGRGGATSGLVC